MRGSIRISLMILATICPLAAPQTYQSLTTPNTSACWTTSASCTGIFAGQTDTRTIIGTKPFDPPSLNVSKAASQQDHYRLANRLFPNAPSNTLVFAHLMAGYVDSQSPDCVGPGSGQFTALDGTSIYRCNNHVLTYYSSKNQNKVNEQVTDMYYRGFDGVVIDWYDSDREDSVARYVRDNGLLSYAIMYDMATIKYPAPAQGQQTAIGCDKDAIPYTDTDSCVTTHIETDLCYLKTQHFSSPHYQKFQLSNQGDARPVLLIFQKEAADYPHVQHWTDVWTAVKDYSDNLDARCPGVNTHSPLLVFEDGGDGQHTYMHDGIPADGGFAWPKPAAYSDQTDRSGQIDQAGYLAGFYSDAVGFGSTKVMWGALHKGYNDVQAQWAPDPQNNAPNGRVIDQRGTQPGALEWNSTVAAVPDNWNTGQQPRFVQVATWNDYDEGTEIETGLETLFGTPSGGGMTTRLAWGIFTPVNAPLTNIDHFEIYYELASDPNHNLNPIKTDLIVSPDSSIDMSGPPRRPSRNGNQFSCSSGQCLLYQFHFDVNQITEAANYYVRAVGKPGFVNKMSSSIPNSYTPFDLSRPIRTAPAAQDAFMGGAVISTSGTGTVAISGWTQSTDIETGGDWVCSVWWQDECVGEMMWQPTYTTFYDEGTVSVTVNGMTKTVSYGSLSNSETVAGQLASAFTQDGSSPVVVSSNGSTIYIAAKDIGATTNYSLSASSQTTSPYFFGASYGASPSGSTLTGGAN